MGMQATDYKLLQECKVLWDYNSISFTVSIQVTKKL